MSFYESNNSLKRKKYSMESDDFDNIDSDLALLQQLDEIDKAVPINTQITQNVTFRRPKDRRQYHDLDPSTSLSHPAIDDDFLRMSQRVQDLTNKNSELEGCVQMLKFKTENLEKEKAQLQATIIDVKNRSDKRVAEERALREKSERDLRTLRTTQDIDLQTKEFRERILANQEAVTVKQQETIVNTSLTSKKVVVPRAKIGPHFPRSLADSGGLRHIFTHPKETGSQQMTFPVILSQVDVEHPDTLDGPPTKRMSIGRHVQYESTSDLGSRKLTTDAEVQAEIVNPYEILEEFSQKKIFDFLWNMSEEMGTDDFWNTSRYDAMRGSEANSQLLVDLVKIERDLAT